jgi:ribose 5-phosphate isomerase B
MKIAVGADHAGFELKNRLVEQLRQQGHDVRDYGTDSADSTDYPDYARAVAERVASGEADRGILVCSSGVGMSIAANKILGIRAAVGNTPDQVALIRSHNDANVLTLGARYTRPSEAAGLVRVFLETPFDGGRHARRLGKIADLENGSQSGTGAGNS